MRSRITAVLVQVFPEDLDLIPSWVGTTHASPADQGGNGSELRFGPEFLEGFFGGTLALILWTKLMRPQNKSGNESADTVVQLVGEYASAAGRPWTRADEVRVRRAWLHPACSWNTPLRNFLQDAFSPAELVILIREMPQGLELLSSLPAGMTPAGLADEVVEAMRRRNLVGQQLFEILTRARPNRKDEILSIRAIVALTQES